MRDNSNSFMTRQQYRQLKNQQRKHPNRPNSNQFRNLNNNRRFQPNFKQVKDASPKELKVQRLSKRLNKIIAVIILLIIIVYLILIFVNF